ncbi:MAG: signal peptidase II [Candidatus Omnitrophica bacterium]|nr:signal peptidase II [Candidatus Omnitrophota bacterium]
MSLCLVCLVVFLDQTSKFLVQKRLSLGESLPIIKDFFHLSLVYNRGIAFGMFKENLFFSIGVSLISIFIIYRMLKEKTKEKIDLYLIALSLILGGALGNLIDRVLLGYVVDFLDFRIWPVFNLADSAISIGMIILGYLIFFKKDVSCNF